MSKLSENRIHYSGWGECSINVKKDECVLYWAVRKGREFVGHSKQYSRREILIRLRGGRGELAINTIASSYAGIQHKAENRSKG